MKRVFVKTVGRQDKGSRPLRRTHTTRRGAAMVVSVPQRMPGHRSELKNVDVSIVGGLIVAAQTTGTITAGTLLNGLAQGTTALTRLGRRVTMRSFYCRCVVQLAATTAGASPLRFLVVYDKQANAAIPAILDIVALDTIQTPNNLSNSRRFVTIMDKMVECVGTGGPQSTSFEFYKKLNLEVEFNAGSAGTIADITTGSVYLIAWQSGGLITASPVNNFYSRIRFSDQ